MSKSLKPNPAPNLATILREIQNLEHQRVQSIQLDPRTALLRSWQSERLAGTYAGFARNPRYQPALRFLLDDLYGARDFSQRNHDIQRLYELVRRIAPEPMIRPLILSVELHFLTESLDERLLDVLVNRLNVTDAITVPLYAEAYRLCDNYDLRMKQIELIYELGSLIDGIVRMPFSGAMLNLAKLSLDRSGWRELMTFMERGYNAFKAMRGGREFLDAVHKREKRILDRIFAGDSDPFEFDTTRA